MIFQKLSLILILITLASCGMITVKEKHEFMDDENIVIGMTHDKKLLEKGFTLEEGDLDEDAIYRRDNLTNPDKEFRLGLKKLDEQYAKENSVRAFKSQGTLPEKVDLSYRDSSVKNQKGPRCTAWATVAGMENMLYAKDQRTWDLSEMHLWSTYEKYSSYYAMQAAGKYKIADEKYWPRDGKDNNANKYGHAIVTQQKYLSNNLNDVISALANGHVVEVAMRTPKDVIDCRSTVRVGVNQYAGNGGHAMLVVGYTKDSRVTGGYYFKIKNSWSRSCGDGGYHYISFSDTCNQPNMYCSFFEFVNVDSSKLSNNPQPTPEPPSVVRKCVEWRKKWWPPKCWFGKSEDCYKCKKYEWVEVTK